MSYLELSAFGLAALAVFFSLLTTVLVARRQVNINSLKVAIAELFRPETERIRQENEARSETLRTAVSTTLHGFQDALATQIRDFGSRLDIGIKGIGDATDKIGKKLDDDLRKMGDEAQQNRDVLRNTIEAKLDAAATKQAQSTKEFREEVTGSFQQMANRVSDALTTAGTQQRERLDVVTLSITGLTEKHERAQEALRQTVETRLDVLRTENASKLEEMRKTVDEQLQSTLERRLGEILQARR